MEVARSKVIQYDELERQHKMVCLENKALRWEYTPFWLGGEYTSEGRGGEEGEGERRERGGG